jgi:hypothetical protein
MASAGNAPPSIQSHPLVNKHALTLAFLFMWTNTPMAIAYVFRRLKRIEGKPTFLGFEGPILCTLLLLVADAQPPFRWWLLLLPWVFHFGTWIALLTGMRRMSAVLARKDPRA